MPKILLLISVLALTASLLTAAALNQNMGERPRYAASLIKIKLSSEAASRANLPLGLYAETAGFGINELDQLMSVNGGQKVIRAHRQVKDTAWAEKTGWDRWFLVELDGRASVEQAIASFKANRFIEEAIPEYYAYNTMVPNDTYYANNWGHNNTAQLPVYQSGGHTGPGVGTIGFDADAQLAWDQTQIYGSASIVIAIIDTGVDTTHPDLRLVPGYDYGDNDSNPMDDSADPGHGTSCSGVAAGRANNALGVAGIAGGCSVMPLKIANSAGDLGFTAIENALTHAGDYNVDVASMSFGAEGGMVEGDSPSTDAALEYAYNHGVALFAATANSNASSIAYPSNHNKVISVGAASPTGQRKSTTSSDGEYWWGSNYGIATQNHRDAVDIMAPTILPATDLVGSVGYSTTNYYMWFNGTSCATPYAAGVAALILSKEPSLTPEQLRLIMTSTATDMTYDGGTGWDRYTGYGMVNANSALNALSAYNPPVNFTALAGNGYVNLAWQVPAFGTPVNYKVLRDGALLATVSGLNYTDSAVVNGTTYSYYLTAVYTGGESSPTPTVEATPGSTVSVILGTGTSVTTGAQNSPISITNNSNHGQSVYTAAELNAAGVVGPALITALGFKVVTSPNLPLTNFVVRMKHTTASSAADWHSATGLATTYSNPSYMPVSGGYHMLNFSAPFSWNGTDNILVDTAFGLVPTASDTGTLEYTAATSGYCFIWSDVADQTNVFTGGLVRNRRPNIRLTLQYPDPAPQIEVNPLSLTFGALVLGSSQVRQFTIDNSGDLALTGSISTPAGYSVAEADRSAAAAPTLTQTGNSGRNTLGFSIGAGSSQAYELTFAPNAVADYNDNVVISSNDVANPSVAIAVSGSGYIPPTISIDVTSLEAVLPIGASSQAHFTISNSGSQNLLFVVSELDTADWFSCSPVSGTIAGSGNQAVTCTFNSTGLAPGTHQTTLQIASNDQFEPLQHVDVQLTVTNNPPSIELPAVFSFDINDSLAVDFSPFVSDADGHALTLGCSGNTHVLPTIDGLLVTFFAVEDWHGSEELTFTISDGYGQSADSVTVTVFLSALATPLITQLSHFGSGITLSWESVPNAAEYHIYRASEPDGPYSFVAATALTTFEDIENSPRAFYRIIAVNNGSD